MKKFDGIVFCKAQCFSDVQLAGVDDGVEWEEFAFHVRQLSAILNRKEKEETHIYLKSGDSFVIDVNPQDLLEYWKTKINS